MIVTITSIRLKNLWKFFALSGYALQILKQMKKNKGLAGFKKTGLGKLHYTMSAWETENDMKDFARNGAHLKAMQNSAKLAAEIRTLSVELPEMPSWKEAKKLLSEKGKSIHF